MNPGGPAACTRWALLGPFLALALATCTSGPRPGPLAGYTGRWAGEPVVATKFGAVLGHADEDGTWVWRGIPYAAAPTGDLRWRAPRDPAPWTDLRDAGRFGPACTQYGSVLHTISGTEDCLTLNIWRPRSPAVGLPVYVWIHGGGNSVGSSSEHPDYHGNRVASLSNMVFVSVNYRLGPFGWFFHHALAGGATPEDASGNYGTLDLVHALRFVRDNISAFGGDPTRVLVAGQSAGAMNVLSLLIAPAAQGLFSHALVQSGVATTRGMDEAAQSARDVLELLLRRDGNRTPEGASARAKTMSGPEIATYLRSKGDREILRCYETTIAGVIRNPAILRDGSVIPAEGHRLLTSGGYPSKVPLMIGSTRDEVKLFLYIYEGVRPSDPLYEAAAGWGSERWKAAGVDGVARRLVGHADQPSVYAYHFWWGSANEAGESPLPGRRGQSMGAFHGLDIPFFLGTDTIGGPVLAGLVFTPRNVQSRKALTEAMMNYVSRFVRTGDPNPPDGSLPRWEPWSNGQGGPKALILDERIRMSDVAYTVDGVDRAMRETLGSAILEAAAKLVDQPDFSIIADIPD